MDILFSNIYNRIKTLSEYEGGRINNADGESMFSIVRVTEQDKDLIREYALNAAHIVDKVLRFALEDCTLSADAFNFTFPSDTSLHGDDEDFAKSIESIIVAFIMWHWLLDKSDVRGKVWESIYTEMLRTLPKGVVRKRPRL